MGLGGLGLSRNGDRMDRSDPSVPAVISSSCLAVPSYYGQTAAIVPPGRADGF